MRPPCEYAVKYYLPVIRALIVKSLVEKYGWSATNAARALGISTTASLKYKRILGTSKSKLLQENLDDLANKLSEKIVRNEITPDEFIESVCLSCMNMRVEGKMCKIHREEIPELKNCFACYRNFVKISGISIEKMEVIEEIENAFNILSTCQNFDRILPEVRTNIVMCIKDAKKIEDVAAYPGRITAVRGRAFSFFKPEFGASRHLASVLLAARLVNKNIRGATCIKYDKDIKKAIEKLGITCAIMDRSRFNNLEDFIKNLTNLEDGVIDPGGVQVEPVVYLFGKDATEAVRKVLKVANALIEGQ